MAHPTLLLPSLVAVSISASTLSAQYERESTQPVAQIWQANVSATTIANNINDGYRITDIEIYDPVGPRFSVTMVRNTAGYNVTGWWWYYDLTTTDVRDRLTQNQARPIDIESYLDASGTRRYAVVMVSNTGAAAKNWYLFLGAQTSTISGYLSTYGYRLVDIDGHEAGTTRVYSAIAIQNSGSDARAWWWYLGVSASQVSSLLAQNGARLVDLDPVGNGTYDLIMNRTAGVWGYYLGQSTSQVNQLVNQWGRRVVDIERVTSTTFDVILNANLDARGTRVSQILNTNADGFRGAMLQRIDDPARPMLVALNEGTRFEPASTLKTLPHVYAMFQCARNAANLGASGVTPLGMSGSCPTGGPPVVTETLGDVLRAMMENSDNARTKKVVDTFGAGAMNALAGSVLGMPRTAINHVFGCGGPTPNETTLEDLGSLHAWVAQGGLALFTDTFYELMVNTRSFPAVGTLSIDSIITTEAASEGLSATQLASYRQVVDYAAKGGNYDWPSVPRYHGSYFGHLSLPFVISGHYRIQRYAVGAFFNDAVNKDAAFNAIAGAYCEMLREEIRYSLRSWKDLVTGSITLFGSACAGSLGLPTSGATGLPVVGGNVRFSLASVPAGAPGLLNLGASTTTWNGVPLPLSLAFLGAPGCSLLTEPGAGIPIVVGAAGTTSVTVQLPDNAGLLAQSVHGQFWLLDPPANALGMITTRGATVFIGVAGW